MTVRILVGDVMERLGELADGSINCCVTSPPYWGLRDYGVEGQIGLEPTPEEYVDKIVAVFREVRRALAKDGTLWLNLGDSYAGARSRGGIGDKSTLQGGRRNQQESRGALAAMTTGRRRDRAAVPRSDIKVPGLKGKDLVGIPWRVAFALQADGWYLRSDIIWSKPNPMPESVKDRPTKAHEYVFLLSKSKRYYYDVDAVAEPAKRGWNPDNAKAPDGWDTSKGGGGHGTIHRSGRSKGGSGNKARKLGPERGRPDSHLAGSVPWEGSTRNPRSVWEIPTKPFKSAHFATMPPALAERCIKAGSAAGDCILDPFGGAGTTALVADRLGRSCTIVELNPAYAAIAERRIRGESTLITEVVVA